VAFDGPDAAGKTTLADAVSERLSRPVLRTSVDSWHNPRHVRLGRGEDSPEGYFLDSFDLPALLTECLVPFRAGVHRIRTAAFDHRADETLTSQEEAAANAALVVDGVFLLRAELRPLWDFSVYVDVPESVSLSRALDRDLDLFGSDEEVRVRCIRRYLPGQALYRQHERPLDHTDVLIDNCDAQHPRILRWRNGG
jgi:uridine kinase